MGYKTVLPSGLVCSVIGHFLVGAWGPQSSGAVGGYIVGQLFSEAQKS